MSDRLDFRLHWVEPDPDRERAVDALGLGVQADSVADALLPNITVRTSRARYLSFLCWAVRQTNGHLDDIHVLEARLACEEAEGHSDPRDCPNVIGRGRAKLYLDAHGGTWPDRPEGLYKNTALGAYRPLMRSLGLVATGGHLQLTPTGKTLATAFQKARGRAPRCVSDIGGAERSQIARLLGLDLRMSHTEGSPSYRRRATFVEIRNKLRRNLSPEGILEAYKKRPGNLASSAGALHRAYVWELVSLGLLGSFAALLQDRDLKKTCRRFKDIPRTTTRQVPLKAIDLGNAGFGEDVLAWLTLGLQLAHGLELDAIATSLAHTLVVKRDVNDFLMGLIEQHRRVKSSESWIQLEGRSLKILAPKKNLDLRPRPRTYRLDAFAQLTKDLGLVK